MDESVRLISSEHVTAGASTGQQKSESKISEAAVKLEWIQVFFAIGEDPTLISGYCGKKKGLQLELGVQEKK
jgi:hypothetical protein